jgi:hypothetical protein|tara:strand:+ start:2177 stop:2770 length:594 start_codon:yes stop_codon:yes gene_type:complete
MEKTVNINNFIGVYDGYITKEECNKAINIFEAQDKLKHTVNRIRGEQSSSLKKHDQQYFMHGGNIEVWHTDLKSMLVNFEMAWKHYEQHTGITEAFSVPTLHYTSLKIQKTFPTEGYHVWHIEHGKGFDNECRAAVFSIYLNDVEEGGETEFLHFSKRVKPKTGRIVIWPASFPYLHRGNPPLSGKKYLLTSWLNLR